MGAGCASELPARISSLGVKKPLIVSDKGMADLGMIDKISNLIQEKLGSKPAVFKDVVPNPTDKNVHDGLHMY